MRDHKIRNDEDDDEGFVILLFNKHFIVDFTEQSKGTTLSKTIDYIEKLRTQNERLTDSVKDRERLIVENQLMRQQLDEVRRENALLRANLHMHQQEHQDMQPDAQQMDAVQ